MRFKALVFSPANDLIFRAEFDADDEFVAVEAAQFMFEDKYGEDPNCRITLREVA